MPRFKVSVKVRGVTGLLETFIDANSMKDAVGAIETDGFRWFPAVNKHIPWHEFEYLRTEVVAPVEKPEKK